MDLQQLWGELRGFVAERSWSRAWALAMLYYPDVAVCEPLYRYVWRAAEPDYRSRREVARAELTAGRPLPELHADWRAPEGHGPDVYTLHCGLFLLTVHHQQQSAIWSWRVVYLRSQELLASGLTNTGREAQLAAQESLRTFLVPAVHRVF